MPDTFVHVKGILNDACRDDAEPNFVSQKFVLRWDTPDTMQTLFNKAMGEIFSMQAMTVLRDERKKTEINNLMLVPLHRIARIEFETKNINGTYPQGGEGIQQ